MKDDNPGVDKVLLQLMKKRDEKSLEMLYERYSKLIYSLALRIVGAVSDAEEITQEVFLKLWENAGSYDSTKGSPFSWVMTVARRHAIDRIRSKSFRDKRNETTLDAVDNLTGRMDVTSTVIMIEESQAIRKALNRLSSQDRVILELAYFEGLTHSEIASRLEQPLGTVKTRLRHGIMELKKIISDKAQ